MAREKVSIGFTIRVEKGVWKTINRLMIFTTAGVSNGYLLPNVNLENSWPLLHLNISLKTIST